MTAKTVARPQGLPRCRRCSRAARPAGASSVMTTVAAARIAERDGDDPVDELVAVGPQLGAHDLRHEDRVDRATGDEQVERVRQRVGRGEAVGRVAGGADDAGEQGGPHQAEHPADQGARGHDRPGPSEALPRRGGVLAGLGRQRGTAGVDLRSRRRRRPRRSAHRSRVVGAVAGRGAGGSVVIGEGSSEGGPGSGVAGEPLPRDPGDAPLVREGQVAVGVAQG